MRNNSLTRTLKSLVVLHEAGIFGEAGQSKFLREALRNLAADRVLETYKTFQKLAMPLREGLTKELLLRTKGGPALIEAARISMLLEAGDEEADPFADDAGDDGASGSDDTSTDDEESPESETDNDSSGGSDSAGGDDQEQEEDDDSEDDAESEIPVSMQDKIRLSKSIDDALDAVMVDYETDARKSAELQKKEAKRYTLRKLFEADDTDDGYEGKFDVTSFTSDLARLVKNYENLLDIEGIIVNKAREFVTTKYGDNAAADMEEILKTKFDVDVSEDSEPEQEEAPLAVGAREAGVSGGGGGGVV